LIFCEFPVIGHVSDGVSPLAKDPTKGDGISSSNSKEILPSTSTSSSATLLIELTPAKLNFLSDGTSNSSSSSSSNNASKIDPAVEEAARIAELQKQGLPWIERGASPNVTALLGKTAYLNCRVKNLADKTVSENIFSPFSFHVI
jgi:hypothetical protein